MLRFQVVCGVIAGEGHVMATGQALLPQDLALYEVCKYFGIALEIDTSEHTIVRTDCTFLTGLARDFLNRLLEGYDLKRGIEPALALVEHHFASRLTRCVQKALGNAYRRYLEHIRTVGGSWTCPLPDYSIDCVAPSGYELKGGAAPTRGNRQALD